MQATTSTVDMALKTPIIVPNLMPDEFYPGYFKRLIGINGISDTKSGNELLSNAINPLHPHLSNSHSIFKVASLLNITPENLIRRHTLIPIVRRINATPIHYDSDRTLIIKLLNRLAKQSLCFCMQCIEEDINYWGYSYWRRSHQLPGTDWCSKHNSPLCMIKEITSFYQQPSEYLESDKYEISAAGNEGRENLYVQKFNELIQDYCDGQYLLKQKPLSQLLSQQAIKLDIRHRPSSKGKKSLLDIMLLSLPRAWLNNHFPNLEKTFARQFGEIFLSQDNPSILNVFLTAVTLFPDSENLLSSLINYEYVPRFLRPPDSALIKGYIQSHGHFTNTARLLGLDQTFTATKLPKIGCPSLNNKKPKTIIALKDFYNGESLTKILKTEDLDVEEFTRIIRAGSVFVIYALNQKK